MIHRTTTLAACFIAAALAACSSSSTDGTTSDTDSGTSTGKDSGGGSANDAGGGTTSDTGTGTGNPDTGSTADAGSPDEKCAANKSTCQSCCQSGHSAGFQVYLQSLLTCACKPGVCDSACKTTACAATPTQPDQTCVSCLQGSLSPDAGKSCAGDVAKACLADTDCKALNDCVGGCP